MSFFDEGDDEAPARVASSPPPARSPRAPRPRRPAGSGDGDPPDRQTLLVRRGIAFAAGLLLLILIVLGVSSCQRSARRHSLESYGREVNAIAQDSDQNVASQFFAALSQANGKSALDVGVQINQLHMAAADDVARAQNLSVPGAMAGAQRALLLALDLRAEALDNVAKQVTAALGGQTSSQAIDVIAGQMELLLGADVVYSQRVQPLVDQALAADGIRGVQASGSRWVRDLGVLQAATISQLLTGQGGGGTTAASGGVAPGAHGHRLTSATVGSTRLVAGAVNRVPGGANPTFTVAFDNVGANTETNVKVDVSVAAPGRPAIAASQIVNRTAAGKSYTAQIAVPGVPLGVPVRMGVYVERVPGEQSIVHNKASYTVIFSP